jgi:hypothetical protein
MFTIAIQRDDVTSNDVCQALRDGLSAHCHVLPGMRMSRTPLGRPHPDDPDTILVGIGSDRVFRAQVTLTHRAGRSWVRIDPGGLTAVPVLVNSLGIARQIRRILSAAPSLHRSDQPGSEGSGDGSRIPG